MTSLDIWPYPLAWSAAKAAAIDLHLVAGAEVEARVAALLNLEALRGLEARLAVRGWLDGLEVSGRVSGVATRLCGLTLEPYDETVDEPLLVRAVPAGSANAPRIAPHDVVIDLEADDPPDVVNGGAVDLGAYVVEAFGLGLDPFPRKPGATFEAPATEPEHSPFAVLRALRPEPDAGAL